MGDEQNQERDRTEKKRHVKLRDLKVSKDAHVIGDASGKHQAKLRDLTASKDACVIRGFRQVGARGRGRLVISAWLL
jgi:hypothetical protein